MDHARPIDEVLEAFCARYRRKIVSFRTIAVGLYKYADSQLFAGFGDKIGLLAYFWKGRIGKMGAV